MAAQVKQLLNSVCGSGGSHKDVMGKYREILEEIFKFQEPSLSEGLKTFVEKGKQPTAAKFSNLRNQINSFPSNEVISYNFAERYR